MRRRFALLVGVLLMVLAVTSVAVTPVAADNENMVVKSAKGKFKAGQIEVQGGGVKTMPQISGGTIAASKAAPSAPELDEADVRADNTPDSGPSDSLGIALKSLGCRDRNSDGNVRVNQDCTYRRQAEEMLRYNVKNPNNLVAGQNDSRVGYNKCGFDYSFDGGRTWGDGIPPFYQRLNDPGGDGVHTVAGGPSTFHTYDAGSDPALATDADGRAFFSCVLFDVADDASAIVVTSSPEGAGGSFYNNVPAQGPRFIVAEDNSPAIGHDKEFIVADSFAASPNKNNVYVTWTVFKADPKCGKQPNPSGVFKYCSSPIYGSMSTDHANTWSKPEIISGSAPGLCFLGDFFTHNPANFSDCNFDQGSDPVVRPDGSVVVVFNNENTAITNPNTQELAVICHPHGSGETASMGCGTPTKVGDDVIVGEPKCNFGRGPEECIPGAWIRTNDFPRIAVNRSSGNVYATWQDYRTGEFDIQLAKLSMGSATWQDATRPVNPDSGKDHYFAAIDVANSGNGDHEGDASGGNGDHVGVSYYRTDRIPNENTTPAEGFFRPCPPPTGKLCQAGVRDENSDYALAGGRDLHTPYSAHKISPTFRPPDGIQAGFNGDYSGLVVVGNTAHPIWSDTRNAAPTTQGVSHDEDIFTAGLPLPDGGGDNGGD